MATAQVGPEGSGRTSVVLATYQGERYLAEQLHSLIDQTRPPDELVAVDDFSSDTTVSILEEFSQEAPFEVRLVARRSHQGTAATFMEAMGLARGEFLLICDQDDRWHPTKIANLTAALVDHPSAYLAFSDSRVVDANGSEISPSRWRLAGFGYRQVDAMRRDAIGVMMARQVVAGCSAAIRSSLVPALAPCPVSVHPTMPEMIYDRWISLVAAATGPVIPLDDCLLDYRIHRGQQLGISKLPLRRLSPRFVLNVGQIIPSHAEMRNRVLWTDSHLMEIEKRLASHALDSPLSEERLALARRHLAHRETLPISRLARIGPVMSEFRSCNGYRRFSLGTATAIADLLR